MTQSLITADNNQMRLPLPASDEMADGLFLSDESGKTREFTGARLFSREPETYKAVVALSAEGLGAIRIGRILHVSPNTVLAVRAREGVNVDIEKQRLSELSRAGARMCVEGIIEMLSDQAQVKKMSIKDQGIVFGILAEKSELLSGAPTVRVRVDASDVEVSEYLRWLQSEYARRQTGSGAGNGEQRAVDVVAVEPARAGDQADRQADPAGGPVALPAAPAAITADPASCSGGRGGRESAPPSIAKD